MGDSVVENMFVDEDERATVCISRYLRDAGHSVPVRNAGVTGATTLDLYQLLVAKCLPLRPRGIILTSGMMDIVRMSSGKSFWEGLIEPADALDCPNILGEAESYDGLNATRNSILQLFHSTCTQFNIPFLLTTWGFTPRMRTCAGVKTLGSDYCDWLGRALQINDATRHIAEQNGIYFVDLAEQMQDKDIFYYDGLHPNGRGCKKIGDLIGPELSKILDSKLWF
ncbi:SGNH/GDSL hydrolase family protein [Methylobacterium terrae]|uniref:SGNH/GDSL hydrolase family protein n=1 Tax=Methylobacterium terrae TaxID=2202827 RepID=UPI0013A52F9E|nr:SGNH/GDSL hydrolase family protein [Methylobacterium terrae]